MNVPGYEQLAAVLQAAFDQAAKGKGAERHANDLPFHEQRMQSISAMLDSDAGMAYQVCKKIAEARGMPHDARERELLGAIVYTAGMIIYHRERHIEPVVDAVLQATSDSVARDAVIGFDLADGPDKGCTVTYHHDDKGSLVIDDIQFDEERIDRIAASHGDGEHYAELAKPAPQSFRNDPSFKELADILSAPDKPAGELPNTDALVDPTGRPKWKDVPGWVNWIGQDRKGVWTGFAHKPEPRQGRWFSAKRFAELNSGEPLIGENWVHSLEQRP